MFGGLDVSLKKELNNQPFLPITSLNMYAIYMYMFKHVAVCAPVCVYLHVTCIIMSCVLLYVCMSAPVHVHVTWLIIWILAHYNYSAINLL